MKYFELENDMRIRDRWLLGDPRDGSGQEIWRGHFSSGRPISVQLPLRIDIYAHGRALDFSTNAFGVPIIHGRLKALFERLALQEQMQLFPVEVEGQSDAYYLMNLLREVRCIDDGKCEEVSYRTAEEGYEDGVGEYSNVIGMRIDPSKVGQPEIFRPWGWPVAIIVAERVKLAMEEAGITGALFEEV